MNSEVSSAPLSLSTTRSTTTAKQSTATTSTTTSTTPASSPSSPIARIVSDSEHNCNSNIITDTDTDCNSPVTDTNTNSDHNSDHNSNHNSNHNINTDITAVTPSPSRRSLRQVTKTKEKAMTDVQEAQPGTQPRSTPNTAAAGSDEDNEEENQKPQKSGKSRRELPAGAVATLKAWLLSPEHFTHPYPTPQDQIMLMQKTGIDKKQLKNWFTNARRRIWKPMLKKQLEQGKMAQTGSGAVVALTPGSAVIASAPPGGDYTTIVDHSQVMQQNYQQALQGQPPQNAHTNANPHATHSHAHTTHPHAHSHTNHPHAHSNHPHAQQQVQGQGQQQQQSGPQQYDSYGNPIYQTQTPQQQSPTQQQQTPGQQPYGTSTPTYFSQNQYNGQQQQSSNAMAPSNSIGSLPQMPGATPPGSMSNLNKTDSHAVLMELFARDQDLVRQATEGAKHRLMNQSANSAITAISGSAANADSNANQQSILHGHGGQMTGTGQSQLGSQHPMSKMATGGSSLNKLGNVPSLNSWPHFSSVSSLNNLGTMTGVKSITNMSGADLVSQGSLNKKGNLAQVKSIENMGRADSYAFLEVFFDNAGSNTSSTQIQRGVKREREEDDNVGLSLDGDEQSPPSTNPVSTVTSMKPESSAPVAAPLPSEGPDKEGLKRAYDDALAARGLISVSRSSEKLTDLALPAKMQRTISQEYLKSMSTGTPTTFTSFSFNSNPPAPPPLAVPTSVPSQTVPGDNSTVSIPNQQQFNHPGHPGQQFQQQMPTQLQIHNSANITCHSADSSVEVPATTKCSLCNCINVDTQLRPCGCMFHGRCLKPSLQNAVGPPKCPIDNITMQSAVLAIPTDENPNNNSNTNKMTNNNNNNSMQSTSYPTTATTTTTPLTSKQEVANTSTV